MGGVNRRMRRQVKVDQVAVVDQVIQLSQRVQKLEANFVMVIKVLTERGLVRSEQRTQSGLIVPGAGA